MSCSVMSSCGFPITKRAFSLRIVLFAGMSLVAKAPQFFPGEGLSLKGALLGSGKFW